MLTEVSVRPAGFIFYEFDVVGWFVMNTKENIGAFLLFGHKTEDVSIMSSITRNIRKHTFLTWQQFNLNFVMMPSNPSQAFVLCEFFV